MLQILYIYEPLSLTVVPRGTESYPSFTADDMRLWEARWLVQGQADNK